MNLNDLKYRLLKDRLQIVVFDMSGKLISSCHTLTDLSSFEGSSLFDWSPFLASIKPELSQLTLASTPLHYAAIEFSRGDFDGFFDFQFMLLPEFKDHIVWLIHNQTHSYEEIQRIQSERNLLLIELEHLKIKTGHS